MFFKYIYNNNNNNNNKTPRPGGPHSREAHRSLVGGSIL